jgi:hypothetical protein
VAGPSNIHVGGPTEANRTAGARQSTGTWRTTQGV